MWEGQKPPAPARVGPRESYLPDHVPFFRAQEPRPGESESPRPEPTQSTNRNPESRCLLLELILPLPPYLLRKVPLSSEKDVDRQRVRPETVRIE